MPKTKKVKLFKKAVTPRDWNNHYSKLGNGYIFQEKTNINGKTRVIMSFYAAPEDVSNECNTLTEEEYKKHKNAKGE